MVTTAASTVQRIGKFTTVRVLGHGARGTVYLASDETLGRQVVLRLLPAPASRDTTPREQLASARGAAALAHPNIASLYDAIEEAGRAYVVAEYVEGETLAARIARAGPIDTVRAVQIGIALASALAHAHDRDVVHRNVRPTNVMLGRDQVVRLMDLGTGFDGADQAATPPRAQPYLAPEAQYRGRFLPAGDIFSLGAVLYEMLAGIPPGAGAGPVPAAPCDPPSRRNPDVDAQLDAIVMKALASDAIDRHESAEVLAAALQSYLDPEATPGKAPANRGTLEYLLRRIRQKGDFPALASTISAVNRVSLSDREPVGVLCNSILKDFSLTSRLLKLVNASHLAHFGGSVSTVSRAVSILGFDMVRNVSMSLALFEHLHDRANAVALRDQVVATYFSGLLARELFDRADLQDAEQAFICAMFHRLGRLLTTFYLHDEFELIARHVQARGWKEAHAAKVVLGIDYEELGAGVARAWNFPSEIVESMRTLEDPVRRRPTQQTEKLRIVASLANELSDAVAITDEPARKKHLARLVEHYAQGTGITERALSGAVQATTKVLVRDADVLGHGVARSAFLASARAWGDGADAARGAHHADAFPPAGPQDTDRGGASPAVAPPGLPRVGARPGADAAAGAGALAPASGELEEIARTRQITNDERLEPAESRAGPQAAAAARPGQRHAALAAGVQDITDALVGEPTLNDILRIVLETMYRAIGFQRVLLFVLDPRMQALRCRFGFGVDSDRIVESGVCVPLNGRRDLFYAATVMGADLCIDDLESERVRQHVPKWYRDAIGARGIVLLPIVNKKQTLGLIYGDSNTPATLHFSVEELGLLKTLRNQALLAMRQLS